MKKDGMSLARVGAPKNNEVGVLHLAIRTCPASGTKNRRQTGDAGGMSSAIATIDVVRTHDGPGKLLGKIIQLVRRLRTTEHAEALRARGLSLMRRKPAPRSQEPGPNWRDEALHSPESRVS